MTTAVVYFATAKNRRQWNALERVTAGLHAAGVDVTATRDAISDQADLDVIFSWGPSAPFREVILNLGRRVLALEAGVLPPVGVRREKSWWWGPEGYLRFTLFSSFGVYRVHPREPDLGLGKARFEALGHDVRPWAYADHRVLVCGSTRGDHAAYGTEPGPWARSTCDAIRKLGLKPFYRPHPRFVPSPDEVPRSVVTLPPTLPLDRLLRSQPWRAVVTLGGGPTVDATLAGVPCVRLPPDARPTPWPHSFSLLTRLVHPEELLFDQHRWAWSVAVSQWTLDELATALPYRTWKELLSCAS